MRHIFQVGLILLSLMMLALAGCSSSSSGSAASDPFATTSGATGSDTRLGTTIFGNVSTATGRTGITLSTDRATVDANNGQVVVTAKIISNGVASSGVPVTFSIVAPLGGPATVEAGLTTVTTDSNGTAITRIATGSSSSTSNVIVAASASIGGQRATATTTFQIVRGTGVIAFGATPAQSSRINPGLEAVRVFQQQIPLRLTDSNGNPRVGAAVTLSVYTNSGGSTVAITQPTVSTDASGVAIFNATVTMAAPTAGLTTMDSVIFQAATGDAAPVVGYAAEYYSLTSTVPGAATGVITFVTTANSSDPNGTLTVLSNTEKYNSPAAFITFRQLIPFKLTDANGNPRIGVPVTLEVYSQSGSADVTINFLKNGVIEPTARTVTSDSAGSGIFNITVTMPVPATPGFNFNDGIVYRAVTNDPIPLVAYGGFVVNSSREPAPEIPAKSIVISPDVAHFAATDTVGTVLQFTISGGKPPYLVTASNPARVSVVLQPNGVTAIATLLDASQWTGSVSFSVLDSQGSGTAVTPLISRD